MSLEKYKRFIAILDSGLPMPKDLVLWQKTALQESITTGVPLDICLGLRGAGIRSLKTQYLDAKRNDLILLALYSCTGHRVWNKCEILSDLIKRYPRSKNENPYLEQIFSVGIEPPESPGQIFGIFKKLSKSPGYSSSETNNLIEACSYQPKALTFMNTANRLVQAAVAHFISSGYAYNEAVAKLSEALDHEKSDIPEVSRLLEYCGNPLDPNLIHYVYRKKNA